MRTIYIDELFVLNLVVNYILLFVTRRILRTRASQPRLLMGSAIGALYAVLMFLPHHRIFYSFAAKILVSMALVSITYKIRRPRQYFRAVAVFYAVSFAFGGAAYALTGLLGKTEWSYLPLKILATSTVAAYFLIVLLSSYFRRAAARQRSLVPSRITLCGSTAQLCCFLDTGNSLYDPVSDSPVMVVEYESVASLLPVGMEELLAYRFERLPLELQRRLRLIPYSAVGTKNGVIVGFRPDRVDIGETVIYDVVIGLCSNRLSPDDTYAALLNPAVIGGSNI